MSAASLLTAREVPGPGVELGTTGINDETGAKFEGDTVDASVVANAVVGG